ncbi:MAG: hypothetical protein ACYC9M_07945 [Desulfobulbaceae bacterium]
MEKLFIGIVKNGSFYLIFPRQEAAARIRLTQTGTQDCIPPEHGELNLVEFEASAVAVRGYDLNGWIYSASIVDTGDPIVTALVENVFGR